MQYLPVQKKYIYSSRNGRLVEEEIGTAVTATCQKNLLACHVGYASHSFVIPGLDCSLALGASCKNPPHMQGAICNNLKMVSSWCLLEPFVGSMFLQPNTGLAQRILRIVLTVANYIGCSW
jgi:hypothetical protein